MPTQDSPSRHDAHSQMRARGDSRLSWPWGADIGSLAARGDSSRTPAVQPTSRLRRLPPEEAAAREREPRTDDAGIDGWLPTLSTRSRAPLSPGQTIAARRVGPKAPTVQRGRRALSPTSLTSMARLAFRRHDHRLDRRRLRRGGIVVPAGALADVPRVIHSGRHGPLGPVIHVLTIFSIPKPFLGPIGVIQRNAVRSWLALRPECEVILLGDEEGTAACAQELGARHFASIARNEYGTPLLDDAFAQVAAASRFPRLCYVNADIILPAAFLACVERISLPAFLMVGQRVGIEVGGDLDLSDPATARDLAREVLDRGVTHPSLGSDYFVFSKSTFGRLPPFAVGRPYWDNWMIYRARELRVPVVDASECVLVVHQNHDYGHVPQKAGDLWEGPEADRNLGMMSASARYFTPRNATWRLTAKGRLEKRHWWSRRDRDDAFQAAAVLYPWSRPFLSAASLLLRRWDRRLVAWLSARVRANGGA